MNLVFDTYQEAPKQRDNLDPSDMVLLLDYGAVPIDQVKSEPSANQPGRHSKKIVAILGCIAAFALIAMAYQFSAEVRENLLSLASLTTRTALVCSLYDCHKECYHPFNVFLFGCRASFFETYNRI